MLVQVLVLSVFAAGMVTVLVLSTRWGRGNPVQDVREDPGEPGEELRAAA